MAIILDRVTKSYSEKAILQNFTHTFEDDKFYCIMGQSGCGKTTLLHIILDLIKPDSGKVLLPNSVKFAPVFQENRLCENHSIGANIQMTARQKLHRDAIVKTLASLGLEEKLLHSPVHTLSGGMKRRVTIARALLSGGDVFVMDEPFKGLDSDTKQTVMVYVKEKLHSKSLIWVTHDEAEMQFMGGEHIQL